jgi:hypothetical protein
LGRYIITRHYVPYSTTVVQKNTGLHEQLKVKPTYVIVFPILSVQALDEFHSL